MSIIRTFSTVCYTYDISELIFIMFKVQFLTFFSFFTPLILNAIIKTVSYQTLSSFHFIHSIVHH